MTAGITVYWRPGCTYCIKLRTQLRLARIPYRRVNIWRDPDAAAFVRSAADGNETYIRLFDRLSRLSLAPRDSVNLIDAISKGL